MAPVWLMVLVPAFKLRTPSVRVIPATEIASFSARLIDPEPEVTVTDPRTFAPSKVIAPPLRLTAPSSSRIAPLWLMALVPAFKLRSPSVRVMPAREISSFSVRLTVPAPEETVTAPRTFAPSKVMAPPVMETRPSAIEMAPVWLMELIPAFRLRSPSVRVIPAREIWSFSVRAIDPAPEEIVTAPRVLAPSKLITPPVRLTTPSSTEIVPV